MPIILEGERKNTKSKLPRCEGWRKHGNFMSLGPVTWRQCTEDAIVRLTVKQDGKTQTLPACNTCWNEAIEKQIPIIKVARIKGAKP